MVRETAGGPWGWFDRCLVKHSHWWFDMQCSVVELTVTVHLGAPSLVNMAT